ncbi:MAG: hypothetical protein QNK20_16625 [Aureibaculum sp.]|nr:hypothetical protein [Aureibaculum sp.]
MSKELREEIETILTKRVKYILDYKDVTIGVIHANRFHDLADDILTLFESKLTNQEKGLSSIGVLTGESAERFIENAERNEEESKQRQEKLTKEEEKSCINCYTPTPQPCDTCLNESNWQPKH